MNWSTLFTADNLSVVGNFIDRQQTAKARKAVTKAQNRNALMTGARNAGILSQHAMSVREANVSSEVQIQRAALKARAAAKVAAAHAGVAGGSVDATEFDITRVAAERLFSTKRTAEGQLNQLQESKYQNEVNTALSKNTPIKGPNLVGAALGIAGNMLSREDTGSDGTGVKEEKSGLDIGKIFNILK